MDNRVCFYSPNDLSIGYNLELAEKAIIKYKLMTQAFVREL